MLDLNYMWIMQTRQIVFQLELIFHFRGKLITSFISNSSQSSVHASVHFEWSTKFSYLGSLNSNSSNGSPSPSMRFASWSVFSLFGRALTHLEWSFLFLDLFFHDHWQFSYQIFHFFPCWLLTTKIYVDLNCVFDEFFSILIFVLFFRLKCEFLGIDIQDDMGRHEVGFVENTIKTPLGIDQEGCLFEARFHINKVSM